MEHKTEKELKSAEELLSAGIDITKPYSQRVMDGEFVYTQEGGTEPWTQKTQQKQSPKQPQKKAPKK